ncbi:hypothetical protein Agub_g11141 [Astrephomene gubernaculifera]|uniref:Uncharacterized protein n=1 Tax=Astrephomene gubernaculifera TaxID=47775 RepID=A0AAD3HQL4_9CHLO|nr:hypothetical protein Agub_g11141 [Astrephomene gubernaculifera]
MDLLRRGLVHLQQARIAVEQAAERKANSSERPTALDFLIAILALATVMAMVLGSVALGWRTLWRTTLHKIGVFRDILGLNRAAKAEAKRRAEAEIRSLKSQIHQQHFGFGAPTSAAASSKDD